MFCHISDLVELDFLHPAANLDSEMTFKKCCIYVAQRSAELHFLDAISEFCLSKEVFREPPLRDPLLQTTQDAAMWSHDVPSEQLLVSKVCIICSTC